jgi:diadenosine tetraphosphate (Ap4A) HIT family hydrolase
MVIYETQDVVVIKKRRHVTHVDCLIIPKKHITNLFTWNERDPYDASIINHIMEVARHLSTMITGEGHFTLVNNNGVDAR